MMKLIDDEILKIVPKSELNGLDSKGLGWLVRDRWGGVDFSKAGNVHDGHYYLLSKNIEDFFVLADCYLSRKEEASLWDLRNHLSHKASGINYSNRVFYKNLCIINNHESKTVLGKYLRKPILLAYYLGVKMFGRYFV